MLANLSKYKKNPNRLGANPTVGNCTSQDKINLVQQQSALNATVSVLSSVKTGMGCSSNIVFFSLKASDWRCFRRKMQRLLCLDERISQKKSFSKFATPQSRGVPPPYLVFLCLKILIIYKT